ncbi:GtrA family protein [Helicovermis profundi]|uniref:GtrA/DPMS transmembrane domain-containing protein n=1 Tax=Helicovermis profundi TaxID=3065157 RepID=A0AAU9E3I3_9FIRM|nr:hypothetical protein HLPR_01240 [Clostridia bacterium S502]
MYNKIKTESSCKLFKLNTLKNLNSFYNSKLLRYFIISCIVTFIDFTVLSFFMQLSNNIIFSNTFGILTGALFQINLNYKFVYKHKKGSIDLFFFIITFLINLFMADSIIYIGYHMLNINMYISKFLSISIPFIITYLLRDYLNSNRDYYTNILVKATYK